MQTQATGTVNDKSFGKIPATLYCNNASLLTITGITDELGNQPRHDDCLWILSIGAGRVDIANQDAGSTSSNRIITNTSATISLTAGSGRAFLVYDANTARWRVFDYSPGGSTVAATVTLTSTSTGTLIDFNPGALSTTTVLRMNNATLATISGLTNNGSAPTDGALVWIESVGAGQVDIANQAAASTAANRIINNVTAPISLAAGSGRALLCYDGTTARWRVLEHTQGAAITPTFAAGDFGAGGAMTWTVDSGDVSSFSYELRGRILTWEFWLGSTTVGGTPSSGLSINLPGSFIAAKNSVLPGFQYSDNGGTQAAGYVQTGAASSIIILNKFTGNWTASTNNTHVFGSLTIEVQ